MIGQGPHRDDQHQTPSDEAGTRARLARYFATRDRGLRDQLLLEHRWLAHYCANRFAGRGEPLDDLVQVAQLGMIKAIERYDPSYGVSFAGFAVPTMLGEIKRHFRDATWSIRVSRRASDLLINLNSAVETLSQRLSRSPTVLEIARFLHVPEEDVLDAMAARQSYRMQPLTTSSPHESPAERRATAVERRWAAADDEHLDPTRLVMRQAITELPGDDQRIVYLRFYQGLTQAEIAGRVGTSQVQVSRRLRRIYRRLERELEPRAI
jgi:RNA polymerase sigma-B factor